MRTGTRGFTLIELMIVIAIVGILASIAMPSYRTYVQKANLARAVSLGNALATKSIEFYNVNGRWPSESADMADVLGTSNRADFANGDNILFALIDNRDGGGQAYVQVTGSSVGQPSNVWLRLFLQDTGSIITKDWCNPNGSTSTPAEVWEMLPC